VTDADAELVATDAEWPGSAGERTELAWSRSALAVVVTAAAILRRVWEDVGETTGRRVAFAVFLATVVAWLAWLAWMARVSPTTKKDRPGSTRQLVLRRVAVATTVFALAALALAVAPGAE
jgi:uncharacterized membrane protein YidH (DUF202 family)